MFAYIISFSIVRFGVHVKKPCGKSIATHVQNARSYKLKVNSGNLNMSWQWQWNDGVKALNRYRKNEIKVK